VTEYFIGLISGTSMDAIDAVLLEIEGEEIRIDATHSHPIPADSLRSLRRIVEHPELVDLAEVGELDVALGHAFSTAALELLEKSDRQPGSISAIGSHGQTLLHSPHGEWPFTLQIGDPNIIAAGTGITTVADFRRRDVAIGGQGAPLVPAFHQAVFSSADEPRAVLNIGGIANLTLLLPGKDVIGFDTGPGNNLMDAWARRKKGEPYDKGGAWGASADCDNELLKLLLEHEYFLRSPPKSTGPEDFHLEWLQTQLDSLHTAPSPATIQATLCELTATTVALALEGLVPEPGGLYVCGGGAHNRALMQRLSDRLTGWRLETTESLGIGVDWVEAAAFGWLAHRTMNRLPGNLPGVTGATREAVLGAIYPA
jgi:anhydro-N-acetylmuramic acid kinase